MRYAQIRTTDVTNGEGFGMALFVQGCHFHCKNCFNSSTWDFSQGSEFTEETLQIVLDKIDKQKNYLSFFSILGGEPLAPENREGVYKILFRIKQEYPTLTLNLWTGYTLEELRSQKDNIINQILTVVDVLIDGRYEDDKRDITLKMRGSSNQRILKRNIDF